MLNSRLAEEHPINDFCNSITTLLYFNTLLPYRNVAWKMDLQNLYKLCVEDTRAYLKGLDSQEENCFELLRLALMEDNSLAFTFIYRVYQKQVKRWVYYHSSYSYTDENADYFVSTAFTKFYFATRGNKFSKISSLAGALAYLKACVHTSISEYIRKRRAIMVPIESVSSISKAVNFDRNLHLTAIWKRIETLLVDEEDRLLAYMTFIQGMKPADIVKSDKMTYLDTRAVSVALQRIRRILRKDLELRNLLGSSVDKNDSGNQDD